MDKTWLLYGAYGYTGKLIIEEALKRGHRPVLAGRSQDKLIPLAKKHGLNWVAVSLNEPQRLIQALENVDLVVHAAGPFSRTAEPMIAACFASRTDYLDITGEIGVFEKVFSYHKAALNDNILLIPGVGFDVVPTDCLVKYVSDQLEDPISLEIGINALSSMSAGTSKTMLEMLPHGNAIRRDGKIRYVPFAEHTQRIRFTYRFHQAMAIPWGDISTAYRTTGIPDITVYAAYPTSTIRLIKRTNWLVQWFMRSRGVQNIFSKIIDWSIEGPNKEMRQNSTCHVWAKASDASGQSVEAWLTTAEGYQFTAYSTVRAVEEVFNRHLAGALTPSLAFGANFVLSVKGSQRFDKAPAIPK